MAWFTRKDKGIVTPTALKREAPDGLWHQCPECKTVVQTKDYIANSYTCTGDDCNQHGRIGSKEYFELLLKHPNEALSKYSEAEIKEKPYLKKVLRLSHIKGNHR